MLKIDMKPEKGILFIFLKGVLDKKSIRRLNKEVLNFIENAEIKNIVLNTYNLDSIDEYGEKALTDSIKLCHKNNGQIYIIGNQNFKKNHLKEIIDLEPLNTTHSNHFVHYFFHF